MSTIADRLRNLYDSMVIANSVTNEFVEALPDCYDAVEAKGGTIPAQPTAANLPDAIASIPGKKKVYVAALGNNVFNSVPEEELGEDMIDLRGAIQINYTQDSMFRNCTNVKKIDLSNVNGTFSAYFPTEFYGDGNLEELYLNGSFSMRSDIGKNWRLCFYGCRSLAIFRVGSWFDNCINFDLTPTTLDRDAIVQFFNDIGTQDSVNYPNNNTITLGAAKLALLSNEDKAIATSKGWTLA